MHSRMRTGLGAMRAPNVSLQLNSFAAKNDDDTGQLDRCRHLTTTKATCATRTTITCGG